MSNFTPITKGKSIIKNMPVTTFLKDRFFPGIETFMTDEVEFDFYKSRQSVALFVERNSGGTDVKRDGFQTRRYTAPLVAPQMPLSKEALIPRAFGDTIHTLKSPEERQKNILKSDIRKMSDMITRREELMCSELICDGKITVKGYLDDSKEHFVEDIIDYGFTNQSTLTGNNIWTSEKSDKYATISALAEIVMKAGYNPQTAVVGEEALKLLMSDEKFLKKFDIKNAVFGALNPQLNISNGNGYRYIGHLNELGIDLFTYMAWYLDENGVTKPYFQADKIAILPERLGTMCYGAVTQLEKDEYFHTREGTRIPKTWTEIGKDVKMSRISSRPIPKPEDVDSWAVCKIK